MTTRRRRTEPPRNVEPFWAECRHCGELFEPASSAIEGVCPTCQAERYTTCPECGGMGATIDKPCPDCGGEIVIKYGKSRTQFFSCDRYPECQFSSWDMPTSRRCPVCGDILLRKKTKDIFVCRNNTCRFKMDVPAEK